MTGAAVGPTNRHFGLCPYKLMIVVCLWIVSHKHSQSTVALIRKDSTSPS